MVKVDTSAYQEAAEVWETLSFDLEPETKKMFLGIHDERGPLPDPLDTEMCSVELREYIGEELVAASLIFSAIGRVDDPDCAFEDAKVRGKLESKGIIGAARANSLIEKCRELGERLLEAGGDILGPED